MPLDKTDTSLRYRLSDASEDNLLRLCYQKLEIHTGTLPTSCSRANKQDEKYLSRNAYVMPPARVSAVEPLRVRVESPS